MSSLRHGTSDSAREPNLARDLFLRQQAKAATRGDRHQLASDLIFIVQGSRSPRRPDPAVQVPIPLPEVGGRRKVTRAAGRRASNRSRSSTCSLYWMNVQ